MDNKSVPNLRIVAATDLIRADIVPLNCIVKDTLYEGLAILAGEPKSGKSWMALQLGCCVVRGTTFLGKETIKSECLYLALEDSYRRLQNRLNTILSDGSLPDGLYFDINSNKLDNGLTIQLDNALKEHPNIKLIIIDTLQLIRGNMDRSSTLYGNDYKDLSNLKSFADKHHITILLIHHFRKMDGSYDIFDKVSGSNGIIGSADTLFALDRKKKTDKEATFIMSGRDIESEELIITLDDDSNTWKLKGNVEDIEKEKDKDIYLSNPIIITIKELLSKSENHSLSITASELHDKIPEIAGVKPKEKKPSGITRSLGRLKHQMLDFDGIYYEAPPTNGGASGRKMYFCIPNRQKDIL